MKATRISAAIVCLFTSAVFAAAEDKPKAKTYALPKDPKAVVISFDYKGGFTPPRKKDAPALSILRDGTVQMPDRFGLAKDVTGNISEAELQSILRLAIEDNKFFEFDPAKVKEKIKKAEAGMKFVPRIADAPNSVIEIRLADKTHKVSQYALGFIVNQYPTVKELQQLNAIQTRLNHVMNLTRLGGEKKLAEMLKLANAELKKQEPNAEPFAASELQSASQRQDGTLYVSFHRRFNTADGKPDYKRYVSASIQIPAGGKAKVTVRAKL